MGSLLTTKGLFAVWFIQVLLSFFEAPEARAQGKLLDLSLTGSYSKSQGKYSDTLRKSWGVEIGLPVTSFFEVSLGHTYVEDQTIYNQDYKDALQARLEETLPEGPVTATQRVQDFSVNGDLGYSFTSVRPSVFGGALRRKVCQEDAIEDYGCTNQDLTWNAGLALQVYITWSMRFKASHRLSPSVRQPQGEKNKNFDGLTSIGLEWSL